MEHVMAQAPGYKNLMNWADSPIMPTPGAVGEIIKKIAEEEKISVIGVDIGGATTDVFSVFEKQFNRTVSANLGMSYSVCNVLSETGISNVIRWIPFQIEERTLTNHIANKMIRPTTIPQTLKALIIEQAIAREALSLSFKQHKDFAVKLKGVQQERTISDAFEQTISGETLVNLMELDMLVGSGGVLSHAPRRHQAARMLIDAFLPEGITQLAVDSIFMMPQLGILSTIHPKAAVEVFEKDCLIRLGTCIAPVGDQKLNMPILKYELLLPHEKLEGQLIAGEIKLIPIPYEAIEIKLIPAKGMDVGSGINETIKTHVYGGVVGIILDGRGRNPFQLSNNAEERVNNLLKWSSETQEYPSLEIN
jgi:hypothetical protein